MWVWYLCGDVNDDDDAVLLCGGVLESSLLNPGACVWVGRSPDTRYAERKGRHEAQRGRKLFLFSVYFVFAQGEA